MADMHEYNAAKRKVWIAYSLLTLAVILVLVFLVARDAEEQFFYSIMPAAAAYVFRPGERSMAKLVRKYTGVEKPAD